MSKRILAVVLSIALCISLLPVLSISSSAENSGFVVIRIFYQTRFSSGSMSPEQQFTITDNSVLSFPVNYGAQAVFINRIVIRNMSNSKAYFSFDLNCGGIIPNSGGLASVSYTGNTYTVPSGVTMYDFQSSDTTPFAYSTVMNPSTNEPVTNLINSSFHRTYYGSIDPNASKIVNFNSQLAFSYIKWDSPSADMLMFFRHVVYGLDPSTYTANMEQYLASIDSNVSNISDWMEEEHNQYQSAWDSGAGDAYDQYSNDNFSFFGFLGDIFGLSAFGALWRFDIFSESSYFFSSWFSQSNSDKINGASRRSPAETEYIDYYSKNQNGELNIFGVE